MKNPSRLYLSLRKVTTALIIICGVSCGDQVDRTSVPMIQNAAIDLSGWSFSGGQSFLLSGDWEFYPGEFIHGATILNRKQGPRPAQLLRTPGSWNDVMARLGTPWGKPGHGIGTLVLRLKISLLKDLVLFNAWAGSAFTLYCGDREIARAGQATEKAEATVPFSGPTLARLDQCSDTTLYWQISNFHHYFGGPRNTWTVGLSDDIARSRFYQDFITIAFAAICLVIAVFYFGIWVMNPTKMRYLVFGGLSFSCVLIRLAAEKIPQRLTDHNLYTFQFRSEFIATIACAFLLLATLRAVFPQELSRSAVRLMAILAGLLIAFVAWTEVAVFSQIVTGLMLFFTVVIFAGLAISIVAIRRHRPHGATILITLLSVLGVVVHDILVLRGILSGPRFGALGFSAMVIMEVVISVRFFFLTDRLKARNMVNLEEHLKLQDSTLARQRTLLAAGSDMWIISDPANMGRILQVSDNTCESLGYTRDELHRMHIKDIETEFPVSTVFEWIVHIAAIRESRKNKVIEGTWRRKDGSCFPVSISVSLHNWENREYMVGFIRDISELRQAEIEHRESAAMLQLIADSVPGPVCYVGPEGKYAYVNAKFEEWFGVKKSDIIGRTPKQVLPQELFAEIEPNFIQAFAGKTVHREIEFKDRHGEVRFLRANHLPHFDDEGKFSGAFGIVFDITDLVSFGQRLAASESRWLSIFNFSPLPSFIWTKKNDTWTLTHFNNAATEYTAGKIEQSLGASFQEFYANSPEILRAFDDCERIGFARQVNLPYVTRSTGEEKIVSVTYTAMPGDQILVRVEDVTEKFNAQKLIEQREGELRALIDNLPVMIGYWDTDLRNRFANRAYESWFGIPADKIPGMHISQVLGDERFQLNMPYIDAVLAGVPQSFERVIPSPDGTQIRYSMAQYIPDFRDGKVEGFYILVSDISEQKKIQKELQSLLTEKETLLAEVHHRVKNNLQVITSLIGLQSNLIEDEKALVQLSSLASRIRVMGQLHTKLYQSHHVGKVNMREYLRDIVDQAVLINNFRGKSIRVIAEIADVHLNMETALPICLIVNEIVSNSQKHAFAEISDPEVNLRLSSAGENLLLEISDNGTGLANQAESTGTLGLRLIRILVQQLHGTFRISSDRGTAYHIEFREQHKEDMRWRSSVS